MVVTTQRRYSVTGQTPPEDAEVLKALSPKLHALDTTVQSGCGFCEGGAEVCPDTSGVEPHMRGRQMSQVGTIVRTSSKRSATQLPSPNSPSHELPPKIARYRLSHHDHNLDHDAMDTDTDTDSDITDVFREHDDEDNTNISHITSLASTPESSLSLSPHSLPDAECLEKLQLGAKTSLDDDYCMEDLALSPPHSRHHSLDRTHFDDKYAKQQKWLDTYAVAPPNVAFIEDIAACPHPSPSVNTFGYATNPLTETGHVPLTFLTLPPEIRHQIYRNCDELVFAQPLLYCIATAFDKIQHPLASVSRQVRAEALAIFYSYNTWTIKVEFKIMYESFQHWIIRLGDGAGSLRLIDLSVRGTLFKPYRTHSQSVLLHGQLIQITPGIATNGREELYSPPDGDASFKIDLSEKHVGGQVKIIRNDGTREAGEQAKVYLENLVHGLWDKRQAGTLNGQDWVTMVDRFISYIGGW